MEDDQADVQDPLLEVNLGEGAGQLFSIRKKKTLAVYKWVSAV